MDETIKAFIEDLDVYELHLINGDHLLALVNEDADDHIILKDPVKILLQGNDRIYTNWFIHTESEEFSIHKFSTLASAEADFHSKVLFYRTVILKNIKAMGTSDILALTSAMNILKNLNIYLHGGIKSTGEPSLMPNTSDNDRDAKTYTVDINRNWTDDIDTSKVH